MTMPGPEEAFSTAIDAPSQDETDEGMFLAADGTLKMDALLNARIPLPRQTSAALADVVFRTTGIEL